MEQLQNIIGKYYKYMLVLLLQSIDTTSLALNFLENQKVPACTELVSNGTFTGSTIGWQIIGGSQWVYSNNMAIATYNSGSGDLSQVINLGNALKDANGFITLTFDMAIGNVNNSYATTGSATLNVKIGGIIYATFVNTPINNARTGTMTTSNGAVITPATTTPPISTTPTQNLISYTLKVPAASLPASGAITFSVVNLVGDDFYLDNVSMAGFDTIAPKITCPDNISHTVGIGIITASIVNIIPTTSDNCAVTKLSWITSGATELKSATSGINSLGTQVFNVGLTKVFYTVSDAAGNSNTCNYTVTIIGTQPTVVLIPNAFSPNNDGKNDIWSLSNIADYPDCEVFVFNRWGEQIFYSKGYKTPWDGKYKDTLVPIGTYSYQILGTNRPTVLGVVSVLY